MTWHWIWRRGARRGGVTFTVDDDGEVTLSGQIAEQYMIIVKYNDFVVYVLQIKSTRAGRSL